MDFFEFHRRITAQPDLQFNRVKPSQAQLDSLSRILRFDIPTELKLYFMRFGSIFRGSICFFDAFSAVRETSQFYSLTGCVEEYIAIENRTSDVLILIDSNAKMCAYNRLHGNYESFDMDLFEYIVNRFENQKDWSVG